VTLVEFLHPIRTGKQRDLVLAVLYYNKHFKNVTGTTAAEIKTALVQSKIPKAKSMNVNSVLNNAAPYVHAPAGRESGAFVFELTDSGEKYVSERMEITEPAPIMQQDISTLQSLIEEVEDETVRGFIEEAILCLRAEARRAAIVLLWSGAIRTLHEEALTKGEKALNDALTAQYSKARHVKRIEDFAWINDRTFLDACPDMSVLDKGQKDMLVQALDLRNKCGHPTKYRPREIKARSFIEDVVGIVFT